MKGILRERRNKSGRFIMYIKKNDENQFNRAVEKLQSEGKSPSEFFSKKAIEYLDEPGSNEIKYEGLSLPTIDNFHKTLIDGLTPMQAFLNAKMRLEQIADIYATCVKLKEDFENVPDRILSSMLVRRRVFGYKKPTHYKVISNRDSAT